MFKCLCGGSNIAGDANATTHAPPHTNTGNPDAEHEHMSSATNNKTEFAGLSTQYDRIQPSMSTTKTTPTMSTTSVPPSHHHHLHPDELPSPNKLNHNHIVEEDDEYALSASATANSIHSIPRSQRKRTHPYKSRDPHKGSIASLNTIGGGGGLTKHINGITTTSIAAYDDRGNPLSSSMANNKPMACLDDYFIDDDFRFSIEPFDFNTHYKFLLELGIKCLDQGPEVLNPHLFFAHNDIECVVAVLRENHGRKVPTSYYREPAATTTRARKHQNTKKRRKRKQAQAQEPLLQSYGDEREEVALNHLLGFAICYPHTNCLPYPDSVWMVGWLCVDHHRMRLVRSQYDVIEALLRECMRVVNPNSTTAMPVMSDRLRVRLREKKNGGGGNNSKTLMTRNKLSDLDEKDEETELAEDEKTMTQTQTQTQTTNELIISRSRAKDISASSNVSKESRARRKAKKRDKGIGLYAPLQHAAAQALYESLGFEKIAKIANYYSTDESFLGAYFANGEGDDRHMHQPPHQPFNSNAYLYCRGDLSHCRLLLGMEYFNYKKWPKPPAENEEETVGAVVAAAVETDGNNGDKDKAKEKAKEQEQQKKKKHYGPKILEEYLQSRIKQQHQQEHAALKQQQKQQKRGQQQQQPVKQQQAQPPVQVTTQSHPQAQAHSNAHTHQARDRERGADRNRHRSSSPDPHVQQHAISHRERVSMPPSQATIHRATRAETRHTMTATTTSANYHQQQQHHYQAHPQQRHHHPPQPDAQPPYVVSHRASAGMDRNHKMRTFKPASTSQNNTPTTATNTNVHSGDRYQAPYFYPVTTVDDAEFDEGVHRERPHALQQQQANITINVNGVHHHKQGSVASDAPSHASASLATMNTMNTMNSIHSKSGRHSAIANSQQMAHHAYHAAGGGAHYHHHYHQPRITFTQSSNGNNSRPSVTPTPTYDHSQAVFYPALSNVSTATSHYTQASNDDKMSLNAGAGGVGALRGTSFYSNASLASIHSHHTPHSHAGMRSHHSINSNASLHSDYANMYHRSHSAAHLIHPSYDHEEAFMPQQHPPPRHAHALTHAHAPHDSYHDDAYNHHVQQHQSSQRSRNKRGGRYRNSRHKKPTQ